MYHKICIANYGYHYLFLSRRLSFFVCIVVSTFCCTTLVGRTFTDLLGAHTTGWCADATTGIATYLALGASGATTLWTLIIIIVDTCLLGAHTTGWSANPAAGIATVRSERTGRFAALLERNGFTGHKDGTAGTLFAARRGKERRFRLALFPDLALATRKQTGC
jgi:hypothetical protein